MGRKKANSRTSEFEYYRVIVSRIIEMIFIGTILIIYPCIFPVQAGSRIDPLYE